ncbi:hypothetical protein CC85DRAFT_283931 [Cutaneotrichosporon oleaginosum]|uniref:Uncharacterized protein n=1 Tax=Cutaneotrichosporon oleaginosum TaxID=879819 RepID=A0A0J0XSR2_9TREE|nr:uncharacterized protein CC85DRAFT_283931 [Cutaneotrichosporon oleaginosum]KLT44141.1 hypothetical protein CC85DRAFT_283931 [Cutaneotrichosporon oleaginosum]TXT09404.1 hypothetical protein COLE_03338 [Cutaneotrichosporon oleaginosum]
MRYVVHSAAGREIDICLAIWLSALSIVYVECIGWVHAISGREPATSTGFSARSTSRINPAIAPSLYRPGRAGHWSSSHCVLYNHKLLYRDCVPKAPSTALEQFRLSKPISSDNAS